MRPEEAKFLVEKMPAEATQIVITSLTHGNDMWRDFVDAGLFSVTRVSDNRNFMANLIRCENKHLAKELIGKVLDSFKKPKIDKMMGYVKGDEVFIDVWMRHCHEHIDGTDYETRFDPKLQDLDVLLSAFSERGININPEYQIMRKGRRFDVSPLESVFSKTLDSNHTYKFDAFAVPAVETLVRHGVQLDNHSRARVLCNQKTQMVADLVQCLDEKGLIKLSDWLTEPCEEALPENLAVIQAMVAKQTIEKVMVQKPSAPSL